MAEPWDRRTPDDHERVRSLVLSDWLPKAIGFSRFWTNHAARAGLDPERIASLTDLRRLPAVREAEIIGAGGPGNPALLMRPNEDQVKAVEATSVLFRVARGMRRAGVQGKRHVLLQEYKPIHVHSAGPDAQLTIAYSRSDLDRLHRTGARAAAVLGLGDSDYLVSAVPPGQSLEFWGVHHLGYGSSMLALHPSLDGGDVAQAARAFALVPATVVAVRPVEGMALAAAVAEAGANVRKVRTIVLVGPPPSPARRVAIADAWRAAGAAADVRVLALWAPSAARSLWAECRPSEGQAPDAAFGLHTFPDLEVLELLDPATGRVVPEGGGDLTYTSAGWHGTALVRHQTGDFVSGVESARCSNCGRTVPRIVNEVVPSAWQPVVRSAGKPRRVDLRAAAVALAGEPTITAWRVEVRPAPRGTPSDDLLVEVAGDVDETAVARLRADLATAFGVPPTRVEVDEASAVRARAAQFGIFADRR